MWILVIIHLDAIWLVSIVSFTVVTSLCTTMGLMGGNNVNSQITLSMPPKKLVTKIELWATVLAPMTKYALEFAPFAIQLEHNLPSPISGSLVSVVICLICWGQMSKCFIVLNLFITTFGFFLGW
ncbi:hypothetical protein Lalb_Chr23g0278201 [Lupinus albus]|uniref:Uncharacterized protein n=1 Tax=Lupinus albus TaxID=3870 RepID=A0A6A4NMP8_LUPAL|nr:hypothetical protein Lalb_Chr23g0278201 [Lupinus albus]